MRLVQVLDWLEAKKPDFLCLQETKVIDEDFPADALREAGYGAVFAGQKTYNGVAILSRTPPGDVTYRLPGNDDGQRRFVAATFDTLRVVNVYVPNGSEVGSEKFSYKLGWLQSLTRFLRAELGRHAQLAVVGDYNIAPAEPDVHDPKRWAGSVLFSEAERQAFGKLLALGLVDSFRHFDQPPGVFSWWDYRGGAFRRNHGLRIDHILCSTSLMQRCHDASIDLEPRRHERPSDHAPVLTHFSN